MNTFLKILAIVILTPIAGIVLLYGVLFLLAVLRVAASP